MSIFKKTRFAVRLTSAFWQAHKKTIVLAFVLGIILTSLAPWLFNRLSQRKKTQRIGVVGKYTPEGLPLEIQEQVSYGLTQMAPDGSLNPALAQSWSVGKDNKLYTFVLKDNLSWHDGTPIKAGDINYNFSDVSSEQIDEKTVEFRLKEVYSPFPGVVSRPVFKKGLIGSGDYQVASIKRNGQIVEEISLKSIKKGRPKLVYRFYPTEKALKTAFKLGEVDFAKDLTAIDELKEWENLQVEEKLKKDQVAVMVLNTEEGLLSEKTFRQALAYATQKDWSSRALGPISPDSWAYNSNLKRYNYDLAKAKEMLLKTLEGAEEEQLKLEITTFPTLFNLAEEIKKDWEELGVKVDIKVVNVVPDTFQAFLVIEDLPSDPDQYLLWHSTQPGNLSRFKSAQTDKLLEDGRRTFDQKKRKAIYLDFQRFLVEDAPVIFLYHPIVYTVSRK